MQNHFSQILHALHAFLKWQAADTTFHTYNADAPNNTL